MWFLKLLKKFVNLDGIGKALTLAIIGLISFLAFFAADYFWQLQPQSLVVKLVREAFTLLLAVSAAYIFIIGSCQLYKDKREWNDYGYDYQYTGLITGIAGVIAFWCLATAVSNLGQELFGFQLPKIVLWYALIPGALILAITIFSFIWKIVSRLCRKMWRSLKDAWDRA